jgi:hypothetical protein
MISFSCMGAFVTAIVFRDENAAKLGLFASSLIIFVGSPRPKWRAGACFIFAAPDYNAGGKPPNLASLAFAGKQGRL